jgi:hypothetical protein
MLSIRYYIHHGCCDFHKLQIGAINNVNYISLPVYLSFTTEKNFDIVVKLGFQSKITPIVTSTQSNLGAIGSCVYVFNRLGLVPLDCLFTKGWRDRPAIAGQYWWRSNITCIDCRGSGERYMLK